MKRTVLMAAMMVSAVALFANGAQEGPREPVWNPVEITGTVSVVDDYPVLTADGETYLLGAPRAAWYLDEIDDGQTITVRGHLVDEPAVEVDVETDAHIAVDQAIVDGQVYPIGRMGAFGGRGPAVAMRGPMHGGPGMRPFGRFDGDPDDRPFGRFDGDDDWERGPARPGDPRTPRGRW